MYLSVITSGAKYNLLAYTTLQLPQAEGSFQSHSLIVLQNGKTFIEYNTQGLRKEILGILWWLCLSAVLTFR